MMKLTTISRLTLLFHLVTCDPQQHPLLPPLPTLRNATFSNASSIATVISAASSPLPNWKYLYQFREAYPEEHHACLQKSITQILSKNHSYIQVIEAPEESNLTVVAVAVWTPKWNSPSQSRSHTLLGLMAETCTHADLNITRALDWIPKAAALEHTYIDHAFGPKQLYLDTLCAHPSYQLRGAGTCLVNMGIEIGNSGGVNVTLLAAPTAEGFYLKRGFREARNVSIEALDGWRFGWNVMAYDFTGA
ncbi:hypothetical protein EJ02DRAFT_438856 [Clathrospora elynae]|uniref:N-acetyltransferase domain-containing protein n=1 Tax=Clathrospora elynae TaxID=706981 RepID=A0A6A5S7W2_9PLEO|nr:hypothetical protein EJ02DRAFT_438856 [Clathrospora elynae]